MSLKQGYRKFYISIITPTYNRIDLLKRLYDSLKVSTYKYFEWVVVDDGSLDGTAEFLKCASDEGFIDIKFFTKSNGGKHTAINLAFSKSSGDIYHILDSDDILPSRALEFVNSTWNDYVDDPNICGLIGRCIDTDSKFIGSDFPQDKFISTITKNYLKYGLFGDKADFIRADYIRHLRLPEVNGCKFVPESIITYELDKKYQYVCFNKPLKIVEYQSEGMTKNFSKLAFENASSYFLRFEHLLDKELLHQMSFYGRVKVIINYYRYLFHSNRKDKIKMSIIPFRKENPVHIVISIPASIIFYLFDMYSFRGK